MACTAVSMEPWPVMIAISVRGSSCLTRVRNSRPDMLGIIRSARMMSGETSSNWPSAISAISASTQSNPTEAPTVMQSLRMLGWSSTIKNRTLASSVIGFPGWAENPLYNLDQLLHAKGLLNVRHAGILQGLHCFFIHGVAGDKQHALLQLRAVRHDPGMHVGPAGAAGRTHIRDDPAKAACFQYAYALRRRTGCTAGITIALQRRANKIHDGALVLNQQQRQTRRSGSAGGHCLAPEATTSFRSALVRTGRRTLNVAPCVS